MGERGGRDWDVIVVGSGFGGAVAALRLSERGYRVGVLEAGRRFTEETLPRTSWDLRHFPWAPWLACRGIQRITFLRDVVVLSGAGVGGGSLVYGNTLCEPGGAFHDPQWRAITDWRTGLAPFYRQARRMLGDLSADAGRGVLRGAGGDGGGPLLRSRSRGPASCRGSHRAWSRLLTRRRDHVLLPPGRGHPHRALPVWQGEQRDRVAVDAAHRRQTGCATVGQSVLDHHRPGRTSDGVPAEPGQHDPRPPRGRPTAGSTRRAEDAGRACGCAGHVAPRVPATLTRRRQPR